MFYFIGAFGALHGARFGSCGGLICFDLGTGSTSARCEAFCKPVELLAMLNGCELYLGEEGIA